MTQDGQRNKDFEHPRTFTVEITQRVKVTSTSAEGAIGKARKRLAEGNDPARDEYKVELVRARAEVF